MKKFLVIFLVIFLASSSVALTPAERQIVQGMKDKTEAIEKQNKQLQDYGAWADQELQNAWTWGAQVDQNIGVLKKDIDVSHENEKRALADNARMKPVYHAVTRWWSLGAFVWGFQQLLKHLLILSLVGSLLVAALWGLSFAFPIIGVGLKAAWTFISNLFSNLFRNILARFKKRK